MTLQELTHGWTSVGFGYATVAASLAGALIRRRQFQMIVLSPLFAIPATFAAAILIAVVSGITGLYGAPLSLQLLGGVVISVLVGYGCGYLPGRGAHTVTEVHRRGAVIQRGNTFRTLAVGAVSIAGIEVPAMDETKHFKLIGTTGAGKSTAIRELVGAAIDRGDRLIIADPDGGYLDRFYRSTRGDVILNPFDERSARWDLFAEITKPYDVEQIARSLISQGADRDSREWRGYARTFVSAVLEYCTVESKDIHELWRLLVTASAEELKQILAGTPAEPFLAEGATKMLHSIRGTATPVLNALKYVKNQTGSALSVRRWVREGTGVLFMPYQAGQIAALRDLIATWMRLAIFEAMSGQEGDRRLWFVIDELDALGQIDGLKDALARLRKFGGRCVLGLQSIAQMRGTYGDTEAQTITENCGNTVILRCSASERGGTAQFASHLIGQREVIRTHTTTSQKDTEWFGSKSKTQQHHLEYAVMPSEIEQIPDLCGYLKLASKPAWVKIQLTASK